MKLTKAKLINKLQDKIEALGYKYIKDSITGSDGLFIKRVSEQLFLSLGLVKSTLYDSKFTGSFYLSPTTRWGSVWGDIPKESYKRIGYFLNLAQQDAAGPNTDLPINDLWWNFNSEEDILSFISSIKKAEGICLSMVELRTRIVNSKEVKELVIQRDTFLARHSASFENYKEEFKFLPKKPIDNIPLHWFKIAESVLISLDTIVNANTVKLLAADVWRQKQVVGA